MKILVIDDSKSNLDAAVEQLGNEHEVITAQTLKVAAKFLCQIGRDFEYGEALRFNQGKPEFDVILTDLYMPVSLDGIGDPDKRAMYKNTEQPYGLTFALTAIRRGIKYIGLNSMASHHDGPILHAIDMIGFCDNEKMMIDKSVFICGCFCDHENDSGEYIKNWKELLEELIAK